MRGSTALLLGLVLLAVGGYLLLEHVTMHGHPWRWHPVRRLAVLGIAAGAGIGALCMKGYVRLSVLLAVGFVGLTAVGLTMYLDLRYVSPSLGETVAMVACLVGGVGLVVRAVWPRAA